MYIKDINQYIRNTKDLKILFIIFILTIAWLNLFWLTLREPMYFNIVVTTNTIQKTTKNTNSLSVSEIKRKISMINKEAKIYNEKRYGPLANDSLVIVVQVHSRILYLKYLMSSLRIAKGISNVLLIFSHDYFDEEINNLIQSIKFCKVMQIFYPYSLQIYPDEFPGNDFSNCSSDTSPDRTSANPSANSLYNDDNTTCRNPRNIQVKHHWWWKANRIFGLSALKGFENPVLFLEDDFYLVEDFIYVLKLMESVSKENCTNCKIMSLAIYTYGVVMNEINPEFLQRVYSVTVSNQFNNMMGFAFTRSTWLEIIQCKHSFCIYNEHNWDFSLKNVLTNCMSNVQSMTINAPRVYHFGTCGMHFTANNCDPTERLVEIYADIFKYKKYLYPKHLDIIIKFTTDTDIGGPYGGWSDFRDQDLCLQMINDTNEDSNNFSTTDGTLHF